MAGAHYEYLQDTSYTVGIRRQVTGHNGTLQKIRIRVEVALREERYHYVLTESTDNGFPRGSPVPRIEFWYDGDRTLVQYTRVNGSTVYGKVEDPSRQGPLQNPSDSQRIGALLTAFRTNVTATVASPSVAGPAFRVRGESLNREMILFAASRIGPYQIEGGTRNETLEALVYTNGMVRTYHVGFNGTYENRNIRVTRTVEFTRVGRTAVDRPDWYREANETE